MHAKLNAQFRKVLSGFILGGIVLSCCSVSLADQSEKPAPSKYYSVKTVNLPDGMLVEEAVINGPPAPPPGFEVQRQAVSLPAPDSAAGTKTLTAPAFDWVFGCSAVSGAMIGGYYDRTGYPNIYTGPTNGGVMPLDNSSWPTWTDGDTTYPNCPLIASHNGVDGRATKGSLDDYWVQYASSASDPYITGAWTQHTWGDAIGDYMKTSQSAYSNTDGATTFYNWTSLSTPLTCDDMVTYGIHTADGTYGRKLFYEARGYTVTDCYNQKTDNTIGGGFSFDQFKAEIDAGRPVMLNLAGHTIVGVGYDDTAQTVYIHDTWDYNNHTMTWGGSYSGMALLSVSIVNLSASPLSAVQFTSITPSSPQIVGTDITFTANATGGTIPQYFFTWRNPVTGAWNVGQAYSDTSSWTWDTTGLPAGTYTVQVWAKSLGSTATYEAYQSTSFILTSTTVQSVSLTQVPSSPQYVGTSITFTANATGGTTPQFYFTWRNPVTGAWSVGQAYSGASSWTWNTTGLPVGTYTIQVWAKSLGSTAAYEAYRSISYTLTTPTSPVTAVTVTSSPSSPQTVGTGITFTAAATGGVSPQYYFTWRNPVTGVWSVGQAYSGTSSWTWNTTGLPMGTYTIQVWAKSLGSTAAYEAYRSISYTLSIPVTAVTLTPVPAAPRKVGTSIVFTANATGGPPQYYFTWRSPITGVWSVGQAYSSTSSWTWNTTGLPAGIYKIRVDAKSLGSTAAYDAYRSINYTLSP